jgi:hypothetical protein
MKGEVEAKQLEHSDIRSGCELEHFRSFHAAGHGVAPAKVRDVLLSLIQRRCRPVDFQFDWSEGNLSVCDISSEIRTWR